VKSAKTGDYRQVRNTRFWNEMMRISEVESRGQRIPKLHVSLATNPT